MRGYGFRDIQRFEWPMRTPDPLESLVEMGIIDRVLRPLMSGKEAQVYAVIAGGEERVAKVYKEANERSFKRRTDYTEGRRVRSSRDARAMNRRSKHGRAQDEAAWRSAEVDVIYRLRDGGVRVPTPYNYMDGVLIMEMVLGDDGLPAPRLGDLSFTPEAARDVYDRVIQEAVRMLCAGVVHGDLSEFNVLMGVDGPVIIDFPQAVDPASNSSARRLLIRDIDNIHRFLSRVAQHRRSPYAQEMWAMFERNELQPDTKLSGQFREKGRPKANTKDVLGIIGDAARDEQRRRRRGQGQGQGQGHNQGHNQGKGRKRRSGGAKGGGGDEGPVIEVVVRSGSGRKRIVKADPATALPDNEARHEATKPPEPQPKKKRRRRRRRSAGGQSASSGDGPEKPGSSGRD